METWTLPPHQTKVKNKNITKFGYDQIGSTEYKFNSLGFRSPEIIDLPTVFCIGNSVSFGIGVDESKTFVSLVAKDLGRPYANLGFGCYFHENHDHLQNLINLSGRNQEDIVLIQINNLDRRRCGDSVIDGNAPAFCRTRFLDYFEKVNALFKYKTRVFLYWDEVEHDLPKSVTKKILIHNKGHLDQSLPGRIDTFGVKSHGFVSNVIKHHLKK